MPALTISRFCSSSLQALWMAFHAIEAGEGDQYVAAGVEAVSRFASHPPFDPHPRLDGSKGAPFNVYILMGLTAENVAKRCNVTREAQDEWAASSQQRAVAAVESGHFDREIVLPGSTAAGSCWWSPLSRCRSPHRPWLPPPPTRGFDGSAGGGALGASASCCS